MLVECLMFKTGTSGVSVIHLSGGDSLKKMKWFVCGRDPLFKSGQRRLEQVKKIHFHGQCVLVCVICSMFVIRSFLSSLCWIHPFFLAKPLSQIDHGERGYCWSL